MRFYVFIICLFCGVISGVFYDVLFVARSLVCGVDKREYTVKDKIFIICADLTYCAVFAAGFIFASVMFDFEELRFYMLLGCLLGAGLYLKSFHVIVAFCVKKAYNKLVKNKENKVGRAKEKPRRRSGNGKRNSFSGNSRSRNNLPAG
ncbi:MAG: hypothetical protein HFE41_02035 [Clostridia bacterium]|jgi:hypothetical protein|nr:hypothetical protein [Clostridia bacterium]